MAENARPSAEMLARQTAAYEAEKPHYDLYAAALKRVLERACQTHMRETLVTARSKEVSSFTEKFARRFGKYPDPIRQFTDLCGARVIVQTLSQVEDVRRFVEQHFRVIETEDISLRLGDAEFGYRDRHYILQLDPQKARSIGFARKEIRTIGNRKAELQIRTWAQHAWADTLHDRTYKSPLKPTPEILRSAALLAALMEDGDRSFNQLANELDGLVDNYAAHHDRNRIIEEIELNELLRQQQANLSRQPRTAADQSLPALKLAKLHALLGHHEKVVELLAPHQATGQAWGDEIRLELGTALCRQRRRTPGDADYRRGHELVAGVADELGRPLDGVVMNRPRRDRLRARALSRLGWIYEAEVAWAAKASECHRRALELQPANPYYLANVLGFELGGGASAEDLVRCLRPVMLQAALACESQGARGLELPFAWFTAGRLRLLLGESDLAFQNYLRGAHHCLDENSCVGCELLDDEAAWLHRVCPRRELPPPFRFAKDLLRLAKSARDCADCELSPQFKLPVPRAKIVAPVVIIAGGAGSIQPDTLDRLREPLTAALRNFRGTVISGGTRSGLPGLIGEIAAALKKSGGRKFVLLGYRPKALPEGAPGDKRYDRCITVGDQGFTVEQILAHWTDILGSGLMPNDVRLIGIGGGSVAAVEYRTALALRARVGVLALPKPLTVPPDAVDTLLADPQWNGFPNLLPLPFDAGTIRAYLNHQPCALPRDTIDAMARGLHLGYVADNQDRLPENLRPWEILPATYQNANLAQAAYAVEILRAVGFAVRPATGAANAIKSLAGKEFEAVVERMAELEHGRWNVERLDAGWRPGPVRDNERRIHPSIVPWTDDRVLTPGIKEHDRHAVRAFPKLLAAAGLEIYLP